MKATNHFKQTIQAYLEQRAMSDTLFAGSFRKPHKSIDDCITYIFNTVQKKSRGVCNKNTEYHNRIINLVESNIRLFQKQKRKKRMQKMVA